MDLDQILPQLLAGECPKTTEDIDTLRLEYGVTTVLCLQTEDEFVHWKIDWDRLEARYRESGIEVQRVPVRAGDPDGLRKSLPECVRALDRLLRNGHKVHIHCGTGTDRAPTVIVAYLHWVQDWDLGEALDYVTACRSCDPQVEVLKLATEDRRREPSRRTNPLSV
jgi:protein-tyrosine phosphatase